MDRVVAGDPGLSSEARRSSVSVCFPTLDEAATIGAVCRVALDLASAGVVDQVAVVDSGSQDDTRERAASEGAEVYLADDLVPAAGVIAGGGKGEAMWKSLSVLGGDIVMWIDADIANLTADFPARLLAPLAADPGVVMSKGMYRRPLRSGTTLVAGEGARVTEIAARPLLQMLLPELTHIVQPLAGEYALRREVAVSLPFLTGYAVDVGLLIDVILSRGRGAVAQVDLGTRVHRNRPTRELGRTAHQVIGAILRRAEDLGRIKLAGEPTDELVQFDPSTAEPRPVSLPVVERPPIRTFGVV